MSAPARPGQNGRGALATGAVHLVSRKSRQAVRLPAFVRPWLLKAVFFIEFIDAARCRNEFLFAREERMAFRANLNAQFVFDRTAFELVSACAADDYFFVRWMDPLFHRFHLLPPCISSKQSYSFVRAQPSQDFSRFGRAPRMERPGLRGSGPAGADGSSYEHIDVGPNTHVKIITAFPLICNGRFPTNSASLL